MTHSTFPFGFLVLVALLIVGLFPRTTQRILAYLFLPLFRLLGAVTERLQAAGESCRAHASAQMARLGYRDDEWKASYLLGAVLASLFLVLFVTTELALVPGAVEALIGTEVEIPAPPGGLGAAVALAILAPVLWGLWVVLESLGSHDLLDLSTTEVWERRFVVVLAATGAVISLAVGVIVGMFRAEALLGVGLTPGSDLAGSTAEALSDLSSTQGAPDPLGALSQGTEPTVTTPGAWERRAIVATMVALPGAVAMSGGAAMHLGPVYLLRLIPVGVLTAMRGLVALIRYLAAGTERVVSLLYGVLTWLLELVQRAVITLLRPILALCRRVNGWAERRLGDEEHRTTDSGLAPARSVGQSLGEQLSRGARVFVRRCVVLGAYALVAGTAWARDVEVPDEPIGPMDSVGQPGGGDQDGRTDSDDRHEALLPSRPGGPERGDGGDPSPSIPTRPSRRASSGADEAGSGARGGGPVTVDTMSDRERRNWEPFRFPGDDDQDAGRSDNE